MKLATNMCLVLFLILNTNAYSQKYRYHLKKANIERFEFNKNKKNKINRKKVEMIKRYALVTEKQYRLPQSLLSALIAQESSFNDKAINHTRVSSFGLGQITLPTAKDYCNIRTKRELFQHDKNIHCTAKILKHHIRKYGNVHSALTAYRAGTPCKRKFSKFHRICTQLDENYIRGIHEKKINLLKKGV